MSDCLEGIVTEEYLESRLRDYASLSALQLLENLINNLFPNNNNQDYSSLIDALLSTVNRLNSELSQLRNDLNAHTSLNYSVAHGGINLAPYAFKSDVNSLESSLNSHINNNNAHGLSQVRNDLSQLQSFFN